jgi:ABC-type glycerol-3-phosphate transport system permease component
MAKMKTNHKHYSAGAVIWIIIKYFSLVFFSFVALLPIVSCVITAFKTDAEYQSTNVMTLPESWLNFQNFTEPVQVSRQRTDPQPVPVRNSPSRNCHAGICVPDHE